MTLENVLSIIDTNKTVWLHGWINGEYVDVETKQYHAWELSFVKNWRDENVFDISAEDSKILIGIGEEKDGE